MKMLKENCSKILRNSQFSNLKKQYYNTKATNITIKKKPTNEVRIKHTISRTKYKKLIYNQRNGGVCYNK